MENKKQTAVEWLMEKIATKDSDSFIAMSFYVAFKEEFQQAKAMEKEEMFEYIKKNYVNGENSLKFHKEEFEQYYNETYGKTKNRV